ncbi:MAG: dTDP-4-dehydrorhamnose reductase [Gemmataceae bacterium]
MKRHAIIGAAGQLGSDFCRWLGEQAIALPRDRSELSRPDELRQLLEEVRPDVVINCAAYNFVDKAESEPEAALAANAWGVRELARICQSLDLTLVHFSSDYVFGVDGGRRSPWSEADAPVPNSVYSLSKLAGECLVRAECTRHFVIRTCGLYGHAGMHSKKGNFVETMLKLAAQGKPLRVVDDQECTPSFTRDVAAGTLRLLETGRHGLYHLTNSGSCTWHSLARAIFDHAGLQVDLTPIPTSAYPTPARRPRYSVLANRACTELGLDPLRGWKEALADYLDQRPI